MTIALVHDDGMYSDQRGLCYQRRFQGSAMVMVGLREHQYCTANIGMSIGDIWIRCIRILTGIQRL